MNLQIIFRILGYVCNFQAGFLLLPCIVAIYYQEEEGIAYLTALLICFFLGILLTAGKPEKKVFYTKEGFVTVALSWIVLSVTGALPYLISGEIASLPDALFESISGFTTTGGTVLTDIESLSHATLLWRCFSNWIGGMGVLVFILAVLPMVGGYNMHLMRAESTGTSVGKLAPKVKTTAMILYCIYFGMTVILLGILLIMRVPFFDALTITFSTAGTGGFGIHSDSLASYGNHVQILVTVCMLLFGINFSVYYLILLRRFKEAIKYEELRYYFVIVIVAVGAIAVNISTMYTSFAEALQASSFQVASIISTTGFSTVNYDSWPEFSRIILLLIMFVGSCAGSTAGGMKVSRIVMMIKMVRKEVSHYIHPRSVKVIKFNDKKVEPEVIRSLNVYFILYWIVFGLSIMIVAMDNLDMTTTVASVTTMLNNVGPGLGLSGPEGNFAVFSTLSKCVLMFDMLAGRLELIPILLLFSPSTWKTK